MARAIPGAPPTILDAPDGRRFLRTAPAHVAELDHLVSACRGAVIVHLHRDIVETIASGASLYAIRTLASGGLMLLFSNGPERGVFFGSTKWERWVVGHFEQKAHYPSGLNQRLFFVL
ncbi:MAG TPA: hypothetical protein VMW17_05785 [Candidatus Binatia bacterium]|nr:hypothetical protein [Candidatus Binatia bacterium]